MSKIRPLPQAIDERREGLLYASHGENILSTWLLKVLPHIDRESVEEDISARGVLEEIEAWYSGKEAEEAVLYFDRLFSKYEPSHRYQAYEVYGRQYYLNRGRLTVTDSYIQADEIIKDNSPRGWGYRRLIRCQFTEKTQVVTVLRNSWYTGESQQSSKVAPVLDSKPRKKMLGLF